MSPARDLLCLCFDFSPSTWPTSNRATKLLERIAKRARVRVITSQPSEPSDAARGFERVSVPWRGYEKVFRTAARLRLGKLIELFAWPDPQILWAPSAVLAGVRSVRARRPDAILVFMMPYSSGLAGVALKKLTGRPLILNLDDSPTCLDMHPWFPSRAHQRLAGWLEDFFVASADAVIYVSETTRARVAARVPLDHRAKLRLIRYGAVAVAPGPSSTTFTIRYVGGMSGWYAFQDPKRASRAKRVFNALNEAGRVHVAEIDHRSSSPVFVGRAVKRVVERNPHWRGRVKVEIFGNRFPQELVDCLLAREGVEDVVSVHGVVSNEEAMRLSATAEMNFLTLPWRPSAAPGGRISAKTYEYLTTDRPILAALSPGENLDFLARRPGVDCCDPRDEAAMAESIERAASAFFAGKPLRFDRASLQTSLSYNQRARELARLIDEVLGTPREAPAVTSPSPETP